MQINFEERCADLICKIHAKSLTHAQMVIRNVELDAKDALIKGYEAGEDLPEVPLFQPEDEEDNDGEDKAPTPMPLLLMIVTRK
jgi:hypothetical protein